jgi:PAS domain S-box-containing protein
VETLGHFEELADLFPEALLLAAGDGTLLAVNSAAGELLGRSAADVTGRPLWAFCADEPSAVAALLKAGSRTRKLVPGGLTLRHRDGGAIACRCEAAVLRPRSDKATASVLLRLVRKEAAVSQFLVLNQRIDELSREIVRRQQLEVELRAATEHLRVTLESIGDAVIATDSSGRITFMNPVAERLTGWPVDRAAGRHLDEVFVIVNEQTREPVESPVAKVLRHGGVVGLANHTVLLRPDGTELPIDDSGAPIRDEAGTVRGVVLVFHDVSERNALQRELLAKTQRLEEAGRRKDEFLSMLAHELRNPLAPLSLGVQVLERKHGGVPGVSPLTQMMGRQISHMVRMVDDLLDASRLTRGVIELRVQRIALREVLEQAVEMSQPLIEGKSLSWSMDPVPAGALLEGDLTRLIQVFANLLSNAAKFTPAGGSIHLGVGVDAGQARVSVKDSGAGIPAGLLPHVFELFVQGDRTLDRAQGGLGIGLTIVRSIVEMHAGRVQALSAGPGLGSEFVVTLPLAPAPVALAG